MNQKKNEIKYHDNIYLEIVCQKIYKKNLTLITTFKGIFDTKKRMLNDIAYKKWYLIDVQYISDLCSKLK